MTQADSSSTTTSALLCPAAQSVPSDCAGCWSSLALHITAEHRIAVCWPSAGNRIIIHTIIQQPLTTYHHYYETAASSRSAAFLLTRAARPRFFVCRSRRRELSTSSRLGLGPPAVDTRRCLQFLSPHCSLRHQSVRQPASQPTQLASTVVEEQQWCGRFTSVAVQSTCTQPVHHHRRPQPA